MLVWLKRLSGNEVGMFACDFAFLCYECFVLKGFKIFGYGKKAV